MHHHFSTLSPTPSLEERHHPIGKKRRRRITYLTDVEGDGDYLNRWVAQSKVLCWRPTKEVVANDYHHDFPYDQCLEFRQHDHPHNPTTFDDDRLVYGGDVWDQGGRDLYVVRQLLHLYKRYPNRVHFVAGNRDLNKLRIYPEIFQQNHGGVYWLRGTGRVGDPDRGGLPSHWTPAERLRWMLGNTMGSPRAFDYRRWELEQERQQKNQYDNVLDDDVVESYLESCHPRDGEMADYLEACHLVFQLGEVAFVHGALPLTRHNLPTDFRSGSLWDELTFAMPWLPPSETARNVGVQSVEDWMDALNQFMRQQVQSWRDDDADNRSNGDMWSLRGGYHLESPEAPPYGPLLQYGMGSTPDRLPNPTVVYNSWGSSTRNSPQQPRKMFRHDPHDPWDRSYVEHIQDFFQRTGVRLLCTGHQPAGELPLPLCVPMDVDRAAWILACDTSYTGDTQWLNLPGDNERRENKGRGAARSGRGEVAVSEVLMEQCVTTGAILEAYCHGRLSDGSTYTSEPLDFYRSTRPDGVLQVGSLASGPGVPPKDGSPHGGHWWTQAALTDGSFLLAAGQGFKFWTRRVKL